MQIHQQNYTQYNYNSKFDYNNQEKTPKIAYVIEQQKKQERMQNA